MTAKLFTPLQAGALALRNRVVMAPLTRNRATPDGVVPGPLAPTYYGQRAGFGLIVSEGTQISHQGQGYAWTPGIYSAAQVERWRPVTEAVHANGGTIVAQIWHVGRVSHTSLQPGDGAPVGPSALTADTRTFDGERFVPTSIDQFMRPSVNVRTDAYGGSVENRTRFLEEVVEAVAGAIGGDRVGLRLSPFSPANGVVVDETAPEIFARGIERIAPYGLAFLHMIEGATGGSRELPAGASIEALRALFPGVYIANNGYDREMAIEAVDSGRADAVAFGKLAIANPDLVERLRRNATLNEADRATFYGGGAEGYTDYPTAEAVEA